MIQSRQPLGLADVLDRIRIEKGIERFGWPSHGRKRVTRSPSVDFSKPLNDNRLAQFLAKADAPKANYRMSLVAGCRDR